MPIWPQNFLRELWRFPPFCGSMIDMHAPKRRPHPPGENRREIARLIAIAASMVSLPITIAVLVWLWFHR